MPAEESRVAGSTTGGFRRVAALGLSGCLMVFVTACTGTAASPPAGKPGAPRTLVRRALEMLDSTRGVRVLAGYRSWLTYAGSDRPLPGQQFYQYRMDRSPRASVERENGLVNVAVGGRLAWRYGRQRWLCAGLQHNSPFAPYPDQSAAGFAGLARYAHLSLPVPETYRRRSVWRVTARGRLTLTIGMFNGGHGLHPVYARGEILTVFVISRSRGRLLRVSSRFAHTVAANLFVSRKRIAHETMWMDFSRYGEALHIKLPPSCR